MPPATLEAQAHALASDTRLEILRELTASGELNVGAIANSRGVTMSAVSRQLAILRAAGFVTRRREAQNQYYSIVPGAGSELRAFLDTLPQS